MSDLLGLKNIITERLDVLSYDESKNVISNLISFLKDYSQIRDSDFDLSIINCIEFIERREHLSKLCDSFDKSTQNSEDRQIRNTIEGFYNPTLNQIEYIDNQLSLINPNIIKLAKDKIYNTKSNKRSRDYIENNNKKQYIEISDKQSIDIKNHTINSHTIYNHILNFKDRIRDRSHTFSSLIFKCIKKNDSFGPYFDKDTEVIYGVKNNHFYMINTDKNLLYYVKNNKKIYDICNFEFDGKGELLYFDNIGERELFGVYKNMARRLYGYRINYCPMLKKYVYYSN